MALIKDGKTTVVVGLLINVALMAVKFALYLVSHVSLFFSDTVDSFVDMFVILLIIVFLRFKLEPKLTYLQMDMMLFSQWSAIIIFRIVIMLDQVSDILDPAPRVQPIAIITVSCIVIVLGIILAIMFVDEDNVIKFFITDQEKAERKSRKQLQQGNVKNEKPWIMTPIFAEALDNLATTTVSLIVGLLLYFDIVVDYLYIIDDVSNIVISAALLIVSCRSMWKLSEKYQGKSYYTTLF
ncbi:Cation efflux family [Plasmodiophora brassicae]|uniref:Cation efflux protein transmembrane domain-containing protein n=1 Tax=Plasmodiophora brassicae TaxID=37360 RepID=A0A0G4ITP1_PLABS|nr:hypothetical protein PBRA_006615 [Plasmodiophora brassicae]SPQ95867.1 unnamed protein product [Plasmodiophora brassicae]